MAPSRGARSRRRQFEDLEDERPRDIDPEDLENYNERSDDAGADDDIGSASDGTGRTHYLDVGKSSLRKRDTTTFGPQYRGSRVARAAALDSDEDDDDPFERRFDDDNDETDTDGETGGRRHTVDSEASDEDEPSDESGSDEDLDDDETSIEGDQNGVTHLDDADQVDRAELRKIMAEEQKQVAGKLTQDAKADVDKGNAVKAQRKGFDTLLNARIRLQKALIATNSLVAEPRDAGAGEVTADAAAAAEAAALTLWNSLASLRSNLVEARGGSKRKRSTDVAGAELGSLWRDMQSLEKEEQTHRDRVLNKWSAKARGATAALTSGQGRLNANAKESTLTEVLASQLADRERLVKRTRMARSCAPVQVKDGVRESADIYDDADFYGLLLKDLLEQRNADAATTGLDFSATAPWRAVREAKTKKVVDTKASKGRKLRYTVHEKLQNFMAPEDRTTWGTRQVDELFGSLFGRQFQLGEDADTVSSDEEAHKANGGLTLFKM